MLRMSLLFSLVLALLSPTLLLSQQEPLLEESHAFSIVSHGKIQGEETDTYEITNGESNVRTLSVHLFLDSGAQACGAQFVTAYNGQGTPRRTEPTECAGFSMEINPLETITVDVSGPPEDLGEGYTLSMYIH